MSTDIFNDLDELFVLAQLVAKNRSEAIELVDRAIQARLNGSTLAQNELILSVFSSTDLPESNDLLSKQNVQDTLQTLIPRLLASTPIERRLEVYQAFTGAKQNTFEVSSFMHRVRRGLDLSGQFRIQPQVTEEDVALALKTYISTSIERLPPAVRGNLESKYTSVLPESGAVNRPTTNKKVDRDKSFKPKLAVRIATAVLLILIASAIGTWIAKPSAPPLPAQERQDILSLVDEVNLDESNLAFRGSDLAQIENAIRDRTGMSVRIPKMEDGVLEGVSFQELAPSFVLPVLHYRFEQDLTPVFILDYSLIQLAESQFSFDRNVLNEIAPPRGLAIKGLGDVSRITFRNRDDVFISYSGLNPQSFRNLFSFDR